MVNGLILMSPTSSKLGLRHRSRLVLCLNRHKFAVKIVYVWNIGVDSDLECRQLFGKGIVGGILRSTIRRNQPLMRSTSHDLSPPLSARIKKKAVREDGLFLFWQREARPLQALRGGFEGLPLQGKPAPNRPTASRCAGSPCAEGARSYPHFRSLAARSPLP
jgi:hypothetical protein